MERDLVERAQRGDRQAFAELASLVSDRLFSIALRVLRDRAAAEDVLQASLVQVWRTLPSLQDVDRFEGWSYRVVVNECRQELRRARHRPTTTTLVSIEGVVGDVQISVSVRDELERAFRRLPADQRAILVLSYYRDLSVREIASILGVTPGTVKSRLHYARQAMRAAIEADGRLMTEGRPA